MENTMIVDMETLPLNLYQDLGTNDWSRQSLADWVFRKYANISTVDFMDEDGLLGRFVRTV